MCLSAAPAAATAAHLSFFLAPGARLLDRVSGSFVAKLVAVPEGAVTIDWPGLSRRLFDIATDALVPFAARQKFFELRRQYLKATTHKNERGRHEKE